MQGDGNLFPKYFNGLQKTSSVGGVRGAEILIVISEGIISRLFD